MTEDNVAARLAQTKLATKDDIADFIKETDFDQKIKNLNKEVTSNKTKYVRVEKKLTELTNKVAKISENWCISRMHFTGDDGYQDFLWFLPQFLIH